MNDWTKAATVLIAFITMLGTAFAFTDRTYQRKSEHNIVHDMLNGALEDINRTTQKNSIRELERDLDRERDPDRRKKIEYRLKDAWDRYCASFPEDREC